VHYLKTLVQLVKSIHLLVLCVIFIYAKLAEFKAVGEQVVLALRKTGDELFGKEQMSSCTTNVKSDFFGSSRVCYIILQLGVASR
jgi:hypothetical protein